MKILNFIERHLGKIVIGGALATMPQLIYQLHKENEMEKYYNKTIELNGHVFGKNAYVHQQVEQNVKNMSPREAYERWKQVNDSLDFEEAKSLVNRLQEGSFKQQIKDELKTLTPQQAVARLKSVVDSIDQNFRLNIVR